MKRVKDPGNPLIYQLRVALREVEPPIWRRVQVRGDLTLARLHRVLQVAMGWTNSHLHKFTVGGVDYAEPDPDGVLKDRNHRRVRLSDVVGAGERLEYEYDFGDGWEHELIVEQTLRPEPGAVYPVCLAGERACPPEDCGGVLGYGDFLEAIMNPAHPEHADMLAWAGGGFDPEVFDLEGVNRRLMRLRL